MKPPIEPKIEDCCNSGCNPCIFDVYEKQLQVFKNFTELGEPSNKHIHLENSISQLEYTRFLVMKNIQLCCSHHLIEFKLLTSITGNNHLWWNPGDHFLFKYNSANISCTRAYTPIKAGDNCDFAIIVKQYENGVVSKHLCSLEVKQETLWRGPYGSYEIVPSKYKRIFMIAQGTGITPFLSIIESILGNEDDMSRIYLLYCCQNIDTLLVRDQLYSYKSFWNFNYEIFVSNYYNEMVKYQEPIKTHKLSIEDISLYKPFTASDQFLLCGSSQFIEYYNEILRTEYILQNIVKF